MRKGIHSHIRESKEKRASRPTFYVSDMAHPIKGLLPDEIAAFYARVDAVRNRALAREVVNRMRPRKYGTAYVEPSKIVRARADSLPAPCGQRLR